MNRMFNNLVAENENEKRNIIITSKKTSEAVVENAEPVTPEENGMPQVNEEQEENGNDEPIVVADAEPVTPEENGMPQVNEEQEEMEMMNPLLLPMLKQ